MFLNKTSVVKIAREKTPNVELEIMDNMLRHDVVNELVGVDNIGIELGIATGVYSKRMINSGKFKLFWGVDQYGDMHNTTEYKRALRYIGLDVVNYRLLRMTFEEAYDLYDDNYFDFIYIDGYAHTGEEGGKTIIEWYKKLKVGGILAGDDYHDDWPLVKWAVNDFTSKLGAKLSVTGGQEDVQYCWYPTWYLRKEKDVLIEPNLELINIAIKEKKRIGNKRIVPRSYFNCRKFMGEILDKFGLKRLILNFVKRNL
ncbi:class I SAM-dependent methyltransferase [Flavobacterium acetivorans]|uniref:class I SAM-dependent methyltransferase n=1 Tax=Flavobacterium acetivorans TaxID=2893883 RepID=UPI001E4F5410|nr:class I SAM-dependent methyltransferase [Flavobacterium sp. F-29]UFH35713.1 class I SAM-dependent methyltransferase [Flavobacterium sp. F-29]